MGYTFSNCFLNPIEAAVRLHLPPGHQAGAQVPANSHLPIIPSLIQRFLSGSRPERSLLSSDCLHWLRLEQSCFRWGAVAEVKDDVHWVGRALDHLCCRAASPMGPEWPIAIAYQPASAISWSTDIHERPLQQGMSQTAFLFACVSSLLEQEQWTDEHV